MFKNIAFPIIKGYEIQLFKKKFNTLVNNKNNNLNNPQNNINKMKENQNQNEKNIRATILYKNVDLYIFKR